MLGLISKLLLLLLFITCRITRRFPTQAVSRPIKAHRESVLQRPESMLAMSPMQCFTTASGTVYPLTSTLTLAKRLRPVCCCIS